MARVKTIYVCRQCGYSASGWMGKCPSCESWGTLEEEASDAAGRKQPERTRAGLPSSSGRAYKLNELPPGAELRDSTGIGELDRVLGGGLVKGSLVLVGGDPGIGKSTLLLQMCATFRVCESETDGGKSDVGIAADGADTAARAPADSDSPRFRGTPGTVLYVSGEESVRQLNMRASRLGVSGGGLLIASEIQTPAIAQMIERHRPNAVIIDSIQTMYDDSLPGVPGSIAQIRGITASLMRIAKTDGVSFLIVGHVTKDGAIAGPKVLEHMVDTVLYFEGERSAGLRILRATKNRFGSTNEIGVFDMSGEGLVEVDNPSAVMLGERPRGVPGSVVVPCIEGTRPVLVEIQALVSHTNAQIPRRMATGVDYNRMTLMAAVLEKRLGLKLYDCDVYVNVTGGLRLTEPACDLGIIAAVASSFRDKPFDPDTAIIGEVGLTGEIRAVDQLEKRLAEASRLGFTRCVVPEGGAGGRDARSLKKAGGGIEIVPARHIIKIFDLFM